MRRALAALSLLLILGCNDSGGNGITGPTPFSDVPPPSGGVAAFSVCPVGLDSAGTITPLGNLAPPGHVLPTNHAYIYAVDFTHPPAVPDTVRRPVFAPARGAVTFVLHQPSHDWKIEFICTKDFYYYLDHVQLDTTLHVGSIVDAGQKVGVTNPGGTIDLGALDFTTTRSGFVNPRRYGPETMNCVTPWEYFTEPLRSQIYARLYRSPASPEKDARIDFDIAGHLVGNWFHETLAENSQESEGPTGWPKTLAFVYDYYDPSRVRVSIGGNIAAPGVWTLPPDAPRPADVTVASGKVNYRLVYTESTGVQAGLMLVQMLADDRLKVEVFEGSQADTASFDDRAQFYRR